jgi:hypothetical protein
MSDQPSYPYVSQIYELKKWDSREVICKSHIKLLHLDRESELYLAAESNEYFWLI